MAWTMGPAVSRVRRRRLLRMHCLSLVLGATTAAAVFVLTGALAQRADATGSRAVAAGAAVIAVGWAMRALGLPGIPYPRSHWQVPEHWRTGMPAYFTLSAYGYLLGLGFLTDVVMPAYWVLVAITVVSGNTAAIALGWFTYVATRAFATARATERVAACPIDPAGVPLTSSWEQPLSRAATALVLVTTAVVVMSSTT